MTGTSQHRLVGASRLAIAVSVAAITAVPPANAQTVQRSLPVQQSASADGQRPVRSIASSWSLNLRATYSDNYRRLPEEFSRRFFTEAESGALVPVLDFEPRLDDEGNLVFDPITNQPIFDPIRVTDQVEIEPPANVIFSAGLRGSSVYQRPGISGVVSGGVQVSIYGDNEAVDSRLSEELASPIGDGVLPGGLTEDDIALRTFGLDEDEEIFIRPDIAGSVTARLFEDLVYVDVAALAQQQAISGRDQIAAQGEGELTDATTFVGGSISPYLQQDIGGGRAEARYRLSGVIVANEQFDPSTNAFLQDPTNETLEEDLRFANDSLAHEALVQYDTAQFFDRFGLLLQASAAQADETGSDIFPEVDLTRLSASARGSYALGRTLSLTGTVGVDDVTVEETIAARDGQTADRVRESDFSGFFWSAGFEAAPSRRTSVALAFGERYGGTSIDGELSYRPSPRINISATAERELGTGAQGNLAAVQRSNSRTLQIVQQLAEIQTGSAEQLLERALLAQGGFVNNERQVLGAAVRNTYALNASYSSNRSSLNANVRFASTEFGEGLSARENERLSFGASARRQVSRRITLGLNGRFERIEGLLPQEVFIEEDPLPQTSDQVFVSADAAYQIGPRISATTRVYHASSDGFIGFGTGREYTENAVSAGISWTF